jgi:ubiquinone/menaquinone biosynthesis C-methylase UbiE
MEPSTYATSQYSNTTDKLTTRIAIHSFNTNPQSFYVWVGERLSLTGDVLDVGAGTGELWRHVDHSKAKLTLVDFSPAMCTKLREIPGAAVHQCDAVNLPFPDCSFDGVIANAMLYHLNDPDAALKEFARVLRAGGKLTVSLSGRDNIAELYALGSAVGRPSIVSDTTRITAESAPTYLEQYFTDVVAEEYPGDLVIPDAEPILAYLGSLGNEPLSAAQEEAARGLIEDKIAKDGNFRVRKHTKLFTATRP